MKRWSTLLGLTALLVAAITGAMPARSQSLNVVIPYANGGGFDVVMRLLIPVMSERLGQSIVILNRPGAAGALGTEAVAKALPDGNTILFHSSTVAIAPNLRNDLPYDLDRDLTSIIMVGSSPYVLVGNPSFGAKSVQELIAKAKSAPGQVELGTQGTGSSGHIVGELFKSVAGVDLLPVPYKGSGELIPALMGGQVKVAFDVQSNTKTLIEGGQLMGLAVTSKVRIASMPNLPTVAESGLPNFEALIWYGMFAPKKTPPEVVKRVADAVSQALRSPALLERFRELGINPEGATGAAFEERIKADTLKWGEVIKSAKITLE